MKNKNVTAGKMMVFDLDDTLLQHRFIEVCARHFNFKQALTLLRQLDHDPVSLTVHIASFLKGKKISEIKDIAESIPLVDDIIQVTEELKKRNYVIGIISDSYQIVTEIIGKKIQADFWLANELQSEDGFLTGQVLIPAYFHYAENSSCKHQVCKTNALRFACKKYKITFKDCIVVGDGENDVCMVRHAGLGVAFCTTSQLLSASATKHIREHSFRELLNYAI
jgi:glucosyl-3-phosphoglycerate synthase